jgi:hypothetical protein
MKHLLRCALMVGCLASTVHSEDDSTEMSILTPFYFISAGPTITKNGPGLELSSGLAAIVSCGVVMHYEPNRSLLNVGMEFGAFLPLVFELGGSYSDRGGSQFFTTSLLIPLRAPKWAPDAFRLVVLNGFYRMYSDYVGMDTFGVSLKLPWLVPLN